MELPNIYEGDYRRLVVIPILLVLVSLFFALQIEPGLEFRGGVQITLETAQLYSDGQVLSAVQGLGFKDANVRTYQLGSSNIAEIEIAHSDEMLALETAYRSFLETYDLYSKKEYELLLLQNDPSAGGRAELVAEEVRQLKGKLDGQRTQIIESASAIIGSAPYITTDYGKMKGDVEKVFSDATTAYRNSIMSRLSTAIHYSSYSFKLINPSLSEIFVSKVWGVLVAAAVLSILTVFIIFRDYVPSVAVLTGAFCDAMFALGFMGLMGIPFSLAALASILMLVGLSLDTDILLTVRILKRGLNNPRQSAHGAMKTGLTMTFSSMLAFGALFIVGSLTNIATYQVISQIVLAGLVGDMIATWMLNAPIMLHHVEEMTGAGRR